MTPEWVKRQWELNPMVELENGHIRTGPVRLSYCFLLTPSKPTKNKPEGGYGAVLLFPAGVDMSVAKKKAVEVAVAKWPDAGKPGGPKLYNPIRDQDLDGKGNWGEAERQDGYVKGAMRIGANRTKGRLIPVDYRNNLSPIVDESRVYSGVWAIATLSCYTFDVEGNKGPTFGLENCAIIADDNNISGIASQTPQQAFAGLNVEAGDINSDKAFGEGQKSEASADADIFG